MNKLNSPSAKAPLALLTATALSSLACYSHIPNQNNQPSQVPRRTITEPGRNAPEGSIRVHKRPHTNPEQARSSQSQDINTDYLLSQAYSAVFAAGVLDIINDRGGSCQGFLTFDGSDYTVRTAAHCVRDTNKVHVGFRLRPNFDANKSNSREFKVTTNINQWTCEPATQVEDPGCYVGISAGVIDDLESKNFSLIPSVYFSNYDIPDGTFLMTPNQINGEWTVYHSAGSNLYSIYAKSIGETAVTNGMGGICQGNSGGPAFLGYANCDRGTCGVQLQTYEGYPVSVGHVTGNAGGNRVENWSLQDGRQCSSNVIFTR